jgi:hypothetical protein
MILLEKGLVLLGSFASLPSLSSAAEPPQRSCRAGFPPFAALTRRGGGGKKKIKKNPNTPQSQTMLLWRTLYTKS